MNRINKNRQTLLLLLGFFAAAMFFSLTRLAVNTASVSGYTEQIRAHVATKPKPATKPKIRLLKVMNRTNPQIPTMYATMVLLPDKKTIQVFLCQDEATPLPQWQSFEAMCGGGDKPRSIFGVLHLPAKTDGSEAANERAMNETRLQFPGMPPGLWEFRGMPVAQSQIESFAKIISDYDHVDYSSKLSTLERQDQQARSSITTQAWVCLADMVVVVVLFFLLRIQYKLFCRTVLVLAFAGELEPSAETDALMPGFWIFVRRSSVTLARDVLENLLESRRRSRRRESQKDTGKFSSSTSSSRGARGTLVSSPINKSGFTQRLSQTEEQYRLLSELLTGSGGLVMPEVYEAHSRAVKLKEAGDVRGALTVLHRAIRLLEKSIGVDVSTKPQESSILISTGQTGQPIDQTELPQEFQWHNDSGRVEYRSHFIEALNGLTEEERTRTIRHVWFLVTEGPRHHSLHTRKHESKLPHSPDGCMVSRGTHDLRFSWSKEKSIIVYWLFRMGDSRARQSES